MPILTSFSTGKLNEMTRMLLKGFGYGEYGEIQE